MNTEQVIEAIKTPDEPIKVPVRNVGIGLFDADGRGVVYKFCDYAGADNPKVREHIALCINDHARLGSSNALLARKVEILEAALGATPNAVPTNWLDSLLSGPDAVLTKGAFDCREIEALLRGVQDRLRAIAQRALEAARDEKGD